MSLAALIPTLGEVRELNCSMLTWHRQHSQMLLNQPVQTKASFETLRSNKKHVLILDTLLYFSIK